MLQIIAVGKNPKKKEISKRLWRIRQGKSEAKVRGDTYEDAKERAAQIGFKKPSSIVLIENPKRKKRMAVKRKKKVICAKKNPFVPTKTKKNAVRKAKILIANAEKDLGPLSNGQRTDLLMDNMPVSHSQARAIVDYIRKPNKREIKARRKILKTKRNPPARKRHETMIVGYSAYHDWDRPKSKRYYFNGEGFSRKRSEAKIFSGDGAKIEAKRMLPYLPQGIYAIRVETV